MLTCIIRSPLVAIFVWIVESIVDNEAGGEKVLRNRGHAPRKRFLLTHTVVSKADAPDI